MAGSDMEGELVTMAGVNAQPFSFASRVTEAKQVAMYGLGPCAVGHHVEESTAYVTMAVLERPRRDVCVLWFDDQKNLEGVFESLFRRYEEGDFVFARLGRANRCTLYGVYAQRSSTAILCHDLPRWVHRVFPVGDEDAESFFVRMMGVFGWSNVEALDGFDVRDLLQP